MVYHAYIKWITDQLTYRFILTAPDPETLDEWWRQAQAATWYNFKRVSAEMYTHEKGNCWDAVPAMKNRLLFTCISNQKGFGNHQFLNEPRANNVSGKAFYIRSKSRPDVYWYLTAESAGRIYASSLGRTRFRLRIDDAKDEDEKVMILSDKISISKATKSNLFVGVINGELYLSENRNYFTYGDLKDKLIAEGEPQPGGESRNLATVKQVEKGVGEEWELVS